MNFGFDFDQAASVASQAHNDMIRVFVIVGAVAALGFFGRLIFVAYGDRLGNMNPLRGITGGGLIGLAAALFVGGLLVTGKHRSVIIAVKAKVVDPFVVSVLKKDSCDFLSGKYCVVVFEGEREIFVNWYDRRVSMFRIANELDFNPILVSRHPVSRAAPGEMVLTLSDAAP